MLTPTLPLSESRRQKQQREMSLVTEEIKAKAEVYHGDETCREKFMVLLADIGLPVGLITRQQDIEECGYVKDIGFVWLKHKERREHKFANIIVLFDTEVTAYFEPNKIRNLTGVKAKEFLIWMSLREIYVTDKSPHGSITFKTPAGLSRSLPLSLFQSDQEWKQVNKEENLYCKKSEGQK